MDGNAIKAVIFDFDGTLYDFSHLPENLALDSPHDLPFIKAERAVRKELKGTDFGDSQTLRSHFNHRMSELTKKSESEINEWYNHGYLQTMIRVLKEKYSARNGTPELFRNLHARGIKIIVLSDYPCVDERMSAIGLGEDIQKLCDRICSAQEFGCYKPAARPFLEIAEGLGVKAGECLVVGDRDDTDGEGARAAGMNFLKIENDAANFPEIP